MLLDQPGQIVAYKLVNAEGYGPIKGGVHYATGETVSVENADTDPTEQCAEGINVADLPWCISKWQVGYRIIRVEFNAKDIACVPTATDGKFRLHRCKVLDEVDLVKIGIVGISE